MEITKHDSHRCNARVVPIVGGRERLGKYAAGKVVLPETRRGKSSTITLRAVEKQNEKPWYYLILAHGLLFLRYRCGTTISRCRAPFLVSPPP